ncbi:integrase [Clostridia bacterium]|nr:integrase [Clostridia bacterium]
MNTPFHITARTLAAYTAHLTAEERSPATIDKYTRDITAFADYLANIAVTKEAVIVYKAHIIKTYAPASVNSMLAALNGFFKFHKLGIKIKPLKIQRRVFLSEDKELTRAEYKQLLVAAKSNPRLYLVIQTICATGIRVSELKFFTVEAVRTGTIEVTNKGKTRTVFLPAKLQTALLRYAKERGITIGSIFITAKGNPLDRRNIWADMKKLCKSANVAPSKVYPHNLRSLFARCFYAIEKDIIRLADLLGHSNVNTTRLYTMDSGVQHRRIIEKMGLVT